MFETSSSSCSTRPTSTCTVNCMDGFTLAYGNFPLGRTSIEVVCTNSATWGIPSFFPLSRRSIDPNMFRCLEIPVPRCQPVLIPDNGAGTDDCLNFFIGKECTISCNFGFELVGNPLFKCERSQLGTPDTVPPQTTRPVCRPVLCPGLSAPSNGFLMGSCSPGKPGMSCMFGCNTGYMLAPPGE